MAGEASPPYTLCQCTHPCLPICHTPSSSSVTRDSFLQQPPPPPHPRSIVAFASETADFIQQTVQVYTVSYLWNQLARESRRHWETLASSDPARNDVWNVLSTICGATNAQQYLSRWEAPQLPREPKEPTLLLPAAGGGEARGGAHGAPRASARRASASEVGATRRRRARRWPSSPRTRSITCCPPSTSTCWRSGGVSLPPPTPPYPPLPPPKGRAQLGCRCRGDDGQGH